MHSYMTTTHGPMALYQESGDLQAFRSLRFQGFSGSCNKGPVGFRAEGYIYIYKGFRYKVYRGFRGFRVIYEG